MAQQTFSGVPAEFTAGEVLSSSDQNLIRDLMIAVIKEGQTGDTGEILPMIMDLTNNRIVLDTGGLEFSDGSTQTVAASATDVQSANLLLAVSVFTYEAPVATYGKQLLSGGTTGKNIKVVATASAGTTIHTAVSGTSDLDEIWLYAMNTDSEDRKLTIEYGGTTSPDDLIEQTITTEAGWTLIVPGLLLQNGLVVKAFAAAANVVVINGYVNRITA